MNQTINHLFESIIRKTICLFRVKDEKRKKKTDKCSVIANEGKSKRHRMRSNNCEIRTCGKQKVQHTFIRNLFEMKKKKQKIIYTW